MKSLASQKMRLMTDKITTSMDKKQRGTSKQERTKDFLSTKDYVIVRKITKKN